MENKTVKIGRFKEYLSLFFPILLISFSSSIYLIVEKILLGFFSTLAMQSAVAVAYIAQIFQLGTTAIAMMAQIFIAKYYGEQNFKAMGPSVWQYIWFSLFSICIVLPLGSLYGDYYLRGMPFESIAKPYLHFILLINFLYPLGTTLSCFYIAQGKTRLVLFSTIGSQLLKILVAYWLIPSLSQKSPLMGLYGAAISTFIAHAFFFCVLFFKFLQPKFANQYDSYNFRFQPKLFWQNIHPGLLRASNKILNSFCGASIVHLMISKTELHRLVFSIGGVIFLFLPFLSEAICQTQTVIVSRIIGAKNFSALFEASKPALVVFLICIALFGIPLLLFPLSIFKLLFSKVVLDPTLVKQIFLGIWVCFVLFTILYIPLGYILSFKDMYFSALMGVFSWINGYLLMYYLIEQINIAPQYFWLALSLMHGSNALIYFSRAKKLCNTAINNSNLGEHERIPMTKTDS